MNTLTRNSLSVPRAVLLGALVTCGIVLPANHSRADSWCVGDFVLVAYAHIPLSEGNTSGQNASHCTLGGRTGFTTVGSEYGTGDPSLHTWICDDDLQNCGVDPTEGTNEIPLYCFGEAQRRDTDTGSPSRYGDGQLVYQGQYWTTGPEAASWPEDQDRNRIDVAQYVRVVCLLQE